MSRTTTMLVTADELAAMGDVPYELIEGELAQMSPTKLIHAFVSGRFSKELVLYSVNFAAGEVLCGEGGCFLESRPDSVIAPDVAFIRAERMPPPNDRRDWGRVPPDVVVEVLSPTNTKAEIDRKVAVYLRGGVPLVWVADTDRETIAASTPDGRVRLYRIGDELDGGDVLPGFRVPVSRFFV